MGHFVLSTARAWIINAEQGTDCRSPFQQRIHLYSATSLVQGSESRGGYGSFEATGECVQISDCLYLLGLCHFLRTTIVASVLCSYLQKSLCPERSVHR